MKWLMLVATLLLVGCGSTTQPVIGSKGVSEDRTLSHNVVDFMTLVRYENNTYSYYGASYPKDYK